MFTLGYPVVADVDVQGVRQALGKLQVDAIDDHAVAGRLGLIERQGAVLAEAGLPAELVSGCGLGRDIDAAIGANAGAAGLRRGDVKGDPPRRGRDRRHQRSERHQGERQRRRAEREPIGLHGHLLVLLTRSEGRVSVGAVCFLASFFGLPVGLAGLKRMECPPLGSPMICAHTAWS